MRISKNASWEFFSLLCFLWMGHGVLSFIVPRTCISTSFVSTCAGHGISLKNEEHLNPLYLQKNDVDSDDATIGTVALVVPSEGSDERKSKFGSKSPVGRTTVLEAAEHLAQKIKWYSDGLVDAEVVSASDCENVQDMIGVGAVIAIDVTSDDDISKVSNLMAARLQMDNRDDKCQFILDSDDISPITKLSFVGPFDTSPTLSQNIPWTDVASGKRFQEIMSGLFERWTSDDFVLAILLFFNQFSTSNTKIPWVQYSIDATWEKGIQQNVKEFYSMITNCGDCIGKCLADENCKACIDALNEVDTRDQVQSYRTVVSYESELLRDFSFCILQKNNVFGCKATIPEEPKVDPITQWRKKSVSIEDGRQMLIGHLDDEDAPDGSQRLDVSWKVCSV